MHTFLNYGSGEKDFLKNFWKLIVWQEKIKKNNNNYFNFLARILEEFGY